MSFIDFQEQVWIFPGKFRTKIALNSIFMASSSRISIREYIASRFEYHNYRRYFEMKSLYIAKIN